MFEKSFNILKKLGDDECGDHIAQDQGEVEEFVVGRDFNREFKQIADDKEDE